MDRGIPSEQLMAELAWVRRLSRALVRDPAAAEDVAHDAWLVAAEQAPPEDRPLRPWLARVVVNIARTRHRSAVRREAREQAVEGERAVPTPAELVERVELQRVVAGEVLALAEPYRSTILLHFVEGYSSAEIARRLGIPDGTVRRRLKVALDQLRAALRAREDRPDKGWLAALAPLATPAPSVTVGVLAMKKAIVGVALVVLLVVLGLVVVHARRDRASTGPAAAAAVTNGGPATVAGKTRAGFATWFAQAGAPDRQIAGHVVAGGAPVAGAIVRLGLVADDGDGPPGAVAAQQLAEVRTGADGAFDFGLQPAAVFNVSAASAGHSPVAVTVRAADPTAHPEKLRLELGDCHSRLFGSVTDASGGPIVRARMSVAGLSGGETDEHGQYSLCLPPDAPLVRVEADGYGSVEERIGSLNGLLTLAGDMRRDFVLVPEAILVGKVVDSQGRPVAGARVLARPNAGESERHLAGGHTDSDGQGAFRIAGLSPGKYEVTASAEHHASTTPVAAVARAATSSVELRIVVSSVARLRGVVLLDGAPVGGAAVAAATASGLASRKCTSQPDGTFVLDGVPMGTVAFTAAPYEVHAPKLLTVDRAELEGVKLEVGASTRIHGHITHDGRPVPGAQVEADHDHSTRADETGAYTLAGLAAGVVNVQAWDATAKAFSEAKRATLGPGDDQQVDLDLDGSGEILGDVVDEHGQPVPGVHVMFELANGRNDACASMTDADGKFDCPMLIGGDYVGKVAPSSNSRQGFSPASGDHFGVVHVPPREAVTGVRLAIKNERLSIRGTVVDDTGAPVSDVHVEALGHGSGPSEAPAGMTDVNGAFEIRDLARGSYSVHAHAADGADGVTTAVPAGSDPVTIKLTRPGAIDGTVAGFSRTPEIDATQIGVDRIVHGTAVVDGATFSVTGLRPGHYTIEARAGAEVDGQPVDVKSGETVHVALKSRGVGHVEGNVFEYGTTTPVVGLRCVAELSMGGQMSPQASDPASQVYSDAAGHFALTAPLGRVRVLCFSLDGAAMGAGGTDVEVAATGTPQVTLYSVRPTFGANPSEPGFRVQGVTLPITVLRVDPSGPAASTGIQAGDHLVTIDGGKLDGVLPIGAWFLMINHAPGSTMTLGIEHAGTPRQLTIQLGAQ